MPRLSRCLLIALMLVLLPLRGWASDAMAVNMAAMTAAKTPTDMVSGAWVQAEVDRSSTQASMPEDCVMHAQPLIDDAAVDRGNCDPCELCVAVANLSFATWADTLPTRHSAPPAFDASYRNAAGAIKFKPPIS